MHLPDIPSSLQSCQHPHNALLASLVLNGCKSRWKKVLSGVPQGSILGSLLYTIYVNDLHQSISSSIFMFADDTKLIHSIQSIADQILLQADLNIVC